MDEKLPAPADEEEPKSENAEDQREQVEANKPVQERTSREKDLQNALEDMKDYAATRKFEADVYKKYGRYYFESDSEYETSTLEEIVEGNETWQKFYEKVENGVDLFDFDEDGEGSGEEREGEVSDEQPLDVGEIVYDYDGPGFEDHDGIEPVLEQRGPGFEVEQRQTSCLSWLKNYFSCPSCRKISIFGILLAVICTTVVVTYFATKGADDKKVHIPNLLNKNKIHDEHSKSTNSAETVKESDIQKNKATNKVENSNYQRKDENLDDQNTGVLTNQQDIKYQNDELKSTEITVNNFSNKDENSESKKNMDMSTILKDGKQAGKNAKVPAKKEKTSTIKKIASGLLGIGAAAVTAGIFKVAKKNSNAAAEKTDIQKRKTEKKNTATKKIVEKTVAKAQRVDNTLNSYVHPDVERLIGLFNASKIYSKDEALKEALNPDYRNLNLHKVERLIKFFSEIYSDRKALEEALKPKYQDLDLNKVERLIKFFSEIYSNRKVLEEALKPEYQDLDMSRVKKLLEHFNKYLDGADAIKEALKPEYQICDINQVTRMIESNKHMYSKKADAVKETWHQCVDFQLALQSHNKKIADMKFKKENNLIQKFIEDERLTDSTILSKAEALIWALGPDYQDLDVNKVERLIRFFSQFYSESEALKEAIQYKYQDLDLDKVEWMFKFFKHNNKSSNEFDALKKALKPEYQDCDRFNLMRSIKSTWHKNSNEPNLKHKNQSLCALI